MSLPPPATASRSAFDRLSETWQNCKTPLGWAFLWFALVPGGFFASALIARGLLKLDTPGEGLGESARLGVWSFVLFSMLGIAGISWEVLKKLHEIESNSTISRYQFARIIELLEEAAAKPPRPDEPG